MPRCAAGATIARKWQRRSPSADVEHGLNRSVMRSAGPVDALVLLQAQQALSNHEQVRQRRRDDEPMAILEQPAVTHLREPEDAFDHPQWDVRPGRGCGTSIDS